ncbi:tRNA1(Val) (adenine(37)-N6)-methyltransferase [Clostridium sp. D2Q-11]|uniref:tRNA1(Val) (Adenine(37)-N6)-methyltransferase n=1 Tax=Anaeromonas frigoriresistens TaxID=2683708 RepID=A0A942UST8_9FIRM|nr:tRNA1(Val) (adenine(37)-N6)-methyltransferase [Anaeromonas frigoriresistens]MBS4537928.1 tRNA1(Val) (adenine(37)-N6)-methyltransferase [Anaeromonas frigoriresistens]
MTDIFLQENERIDDLQLKGLKIIQNPEGFCFGIDAVLLANFCDVKPNSTIVDLGTGTGIIPLILYGKNKINKIYGIEIQEQVANMAKRSMELNNLDEKIDILNIDLKNVEEVIEVNSIDVVVSNPPYMDTGTGKVNPSDKKAISRHEIMCELEDVIEKAKRLLKHNGRFYMVHRPNRLTDILYYLRKHKLEPKTLRFIHPKASKSPNLVLIKAIKAAKPELKIDPPLYVYDELGQYTDEIHNIYGLDK